MPTTTATASVAATPVLATWQFDDPGINAVNQPGTAFVFNGCLYYFGTDGGQYPFIAGYDTKNLNQQNATLNVPTAKYWSRISFQPNAKTGTKTNAGVAAAALPQCVLLFWQGNQGLCAAVIPEDLLTLPLVNPDTNMNWYVLQNSQGADFPTSHGLDVAATALDGNRVFVATILNSGLYIGLFDYSKAVTAPSSGNANNPTAAANPGAWSPLADWTISLQQLQSIGPAPHSFGNRISLEWYSVDGNQFWLCLSLFDGSNAYVYWLPLDITSLPVQCQKSTAYVTLGRLPTDNSSSFYGHATSFSASGPMNLKRDIAGRLRMYWSSKSKSSGEAFNLVVQPAGPPTPSALEVMTTSPQDSRTGRPFGNLSLPPAAAYVQSATAQQVTIMNDPDQGGSTTTGDVYPAGEVIFADNGGSLRVFSQNCAMLQQVGIQGSQNTTNIVLRGIIDGPTPMPNYNTMPQHFQGGYSNNCGSVVYGSDDRKYADSTFQFNASIGVKTSGEPTKGAGPAWDISFSAGAGLGSGSSTSTEDIKNVTQNTDLDQDDQSVKPEGTLFGYGIQLKYNLFRALAPASDGNWTVDQTAPRFIQILANYTGLQTTNFIPYDVIPGNLESYTREAWNQRMQTLGYPSATYFEDVIETNAAVLDNNGNKFLEYAWSKNNAALSDFGNTTSHYTDSSWILTADIWRGFGGGEEVSLFGLGEGMQMSVLFGLNLTLSGTEQEGDEKTLGITVENWNCPDPPEKIPAGQTYVNSYTWRIYFLPSSDQWREDFLAYRDHPLSDGTTDGATVSIDPTSRPWRIVFLVTRYELSIGSQYPSLGDAPVPPAPTKATWSQDLQPGNTIWPVGSQVQYAVGYMSGQVETPQDQLQWSEAFLIRGYMCPELNVPVDTTNWATSRKIWRIIGQGEPEPVGIILDNTKTSWIDDDPYWNFTPPPKLGPPNGGLWGGRSNMANTQIWVPDNTVMYAISYVYNMGETKLGPWSDPITVDYWANPTFDNVPVFPDPGIKCFPLSTGRNLYRLCKDALGAPVTQRLDATGQPVPTLVAQLTDNTSITITDSTV